MKISAAPKDKLFQTAARLFYRQGYRATGVDTLAAESGIGKMTLYRHYPSKDDLVVAYLTDSDEVFWKNFDNVTRDAPTAREQLVAFFRGLGNYVITPECFGCPFLNVATEYPEPGYAGHQVALAHKQKVREGFLELAREAGAREPDVLANALLLVMDGAYMSARVFGGSPDNPAANVGEIARQLIDAQCASSSKK